MVDKKSVAKVSLGFTSESLLPEEVTIILNLQPSRQYKKGDLSDRMRVPKPWGRWALEIEANSIETAARLLLEHFSGKDEQIADVVSRFSAKANVSIWWEPEGGQGGFTLPANVMIKLASLGERVDFFFV